MNLENKFLIIFYNGRSKNYTTISIFTIDENINGNLNLYNNLNIYINYTMNLENEFLLIYCNGRSIILAILYLTCGQIIYVLLESICLRTKEFKKNYSFFIDDYILYHISKTVGNFCLPKTVPNIIAQKG
jgi:hypothetical protein